MVTSVRVRHRGAPRVISTPTTGRPLPFGYRAAASGILAPHRGKRISAHRGSGRLRCRSRRTRSCPPGRREPYRSAWAIFVAPLAGVATRARRCSVDDPRYRVEGAAQRGPAKCSICGRRAQSASRTESALIARGKVLHLDGRLKSRLRRGWRDRRAKCGRSEGSNEDVPYAVKAGVRVGDFDVNGSNTHGIRL